MQKLVWFIGLLLIHSFGVLPTVFLMLTKNAVNLLFHMEKPV